MSFLQREEDGVKNQTTSDTETDLKFFDSLPLCSQFPTRKAIEPCDPVIVVEDSVSEEEEPLSTIDLTQPSDTGSGDDKDATDDQCIRKHPMNELREEYVRSLRRVSEVPQSHNGHALGSLRTQRDLGTGLYKDGHYEAKSLKVHMNPTSIPVLDTPDEGMLHIIVGWKPSEVLSDLCYRYVTQGVWESKTCGFLQGDHCMRKRGYRCNGVMMCPMMLRARKTFDHSTEDEWGSWQAKNDNMVPNSDVLEMKKARNLFVTMMNPEVQFCPAKIVPDKQLGTSVHQIHACPGGPALRQVHATKDWFIGCTHYFIHREVKPRHYFLSLRNYTSKALGYLREMISKRKPLVIPGDVCEFVAGKKGRGVKRCATHGTELMEYGTANSRSGKCKSKMLIMETIQPHYDEGDEGRGQSVTYALCSGSHNHPPPPQADTTQKKKDAFRVLAEIAPMTRASVLKLQTQSSLFVGNPSPLQNINLNRNVMYSTLNSVRRGNTQDEFTSMFELVSASDQPYVRDVRVVRDGIVFLLGSQEMLRHATQGVVFAGDATFKTVMESNPHHVTPNWYLYNFVVPEDLTSATHKGVVVARALMTTLTTEAYTALWSMFLGALRSEYANMIGITDLEVSIDVPYMQLEPERKRNAVSIRSVTTDFEVAEVEGVGSAFAYIRGGSREMHISHLLVGCRVHFERAVLKRAASLREPQKSAFKNACRKLRISTDEEEADGFYAVIHAIDETWGAWLSRSHIRPLVSPSYSGMTAPDRMIALDNTNIVESQNRRGNVICGTALHPVVCVRRLHELDRISASVIRMGNGTGGQSLPRTRPRKSSTLAPCLDTTGKQTKSKSTAKRKLRENSEVQTSRAKTIRRSDSTQKGNKNATIKASPKRSPLPQSEKQENFRWLHKKLAMKCRKALKDGNDELFMALSALYSTVLDSNDATVIKRQMLSTIRRERVGKETIAEFTDLLFMLSECNETMDDTGDAVALPPDGVGSPRQINENRNCSESEEPSLKTVSTSATEHIVSLIE